MNRLNIVLWVGVVLFSVVTTTEAESPPTAVRKEMAEIYSTFKQIQPFLIDSDRFTDPKNRQQLLSLITAINERFHTIEAFNNSYLEKPGFRPRLESLESALQDAKISYEDDELHRSLVGLKTVSNHCAGCHSQYGVRVDLHEQPEDFAKLPPFTQGEFFLISQDFQKAKQAYYTSALNPSADKKARMDALQKWLMVSVRFSPNPDEALTQLQRFRKKTSLNEYNSFVLDEWIKSLKRWQQEKSNNNEPLKEAERLLQQGIPGTDPFMQSVGMVELLRAAAVLDTLLGKSDVAEQRRRALYLTGISYSKLPSIFINELPEVFFEQCIREFPGTQEAQLSYRFYHELMTGPYIFGTESALPPILEQQLQELHELAYGKERKR